MSRALAWSGYAAAGAVLVAIAADFASHSGRRAEPIVPAPAGFRQHLRGIGPVEVGFVGRTVFITDRLEEDPEEAAAARVPAWRVEGDYPAPEGGGVAVARAHIAAPRGGETAALTVDAPRAWVPLARAEGEIRLDLEREWRLDRPTLTFPGFAPGRNLVAQADGEAWLDPRAETVRSPGRFTIASEDLELEAADFRYDARTRTIRFAPAAGEVRWSLRDATGRTFRGTCDGPGEVLPAADGGVELRLTGGALGVRATLPGAPDAPSARVLGRDLAVTAVPAGENGWLPQRARAAGPVFLADARLAFEGTGAELEWDAAGEPLALHLAGPASVRPWDDSFTVFTARRSVRYDPALGLLTCDGRSLAVDGRGQVAADHAEWDGRMLRARGEVVAHSTQGAARADALEADPDGGLRAEGDVRVFPASGPAAELRAPALTLDRAGTMRLERGFLARGAREGEPWELEAGSGLSRLLDGGERRTDAAGGVIHRTPGIEVRADTLEQLDAQSFRLDGAPGVATMALENGSVARASFRRAIHDGQRLRIEGAPHLTVPAAALGLSGADVELDARTVARDHATGAWMLEQEVRCRGALEAAADRITWSPQSGLLLERRSPAPTASGTLADGRTFSATARSIAMDPARSVRLEGDAVARLVEADGRTHVLTAERAQLGETGGFAEGRARFDSPLGRGSGQRADWRSAEGRIVWLRIAGDAALAVDRLRADGAVIEMDEANGLMSITGDAVRAAHIVTEEGREATAEWLRYDVGAKLLETGPARFTAPAPGEPPAPPK